MSDLYSKASLVMNPQLVDTGKVYSIKPEDRKGDFTFTRSSAATRVNADGLVEKETQNLLTYSNDFSQWISNNTSETSGQVGYDGSNDAWLLSKSASSARVQQSISTSGVQTYSVYVKAGTLNYVMLNNSVVSQWFDLSNGTIGTNSSSANTIDASIESVGNGWYRCSLIFNSSISIVRIYPSQADNDVNGTSGNIYIQDAQLEQGLVARDVITTTTTAVEGGITDNVPRLDYTDSSCPALLLEPQRTNLIESSEFFDDGGYGFTNLNREAYSTISPEGVQNAYKLIPNTTNGVHLMTNTTSNNAVYSVFAKQGGYKRFRFNSGSSGDGFASYDLNLGQVVGSGGTYYIDSGIVDYGNGWYRCYLVLGATTGLVTTMAIEDNSGSVTFIGDGTSGIYVYGMQAEAGSYATSYIPTYGSSVTRVQDSFYDNNYQANNIFGANSGSIFFDFGDDFTLFDGVSNSYPIDRMQFVDITSYGGGYMRFRGGESNHYFQLVSMGAADNSLSFTNQTKYCICWDSNGVDFYGDGALIDSTTIEIVPSINRIENGLSGTQRETRIKEILFFTTKLSSQEAIDLTTIV